MNLTVLLVLVLIALGCTIASACGKCPLWVPVFILCVYLLIQQMPVGKS